MTTIGPDDGDTLPRAALLSSIGAAFGALGRVLLCLDSDFRVVHASRLLVDLIGEKAVRNCVGRPVDELLGPGLFDESGTLRQALLHGERREGWRSHLVSESGEQRVVSVTAAPFVPEPGMVCELRVRYLVVIRPAEEDASVGTEPTTLFAGLIGRSPAMLRLFRLIENLSHTEATVLLTGESGTGKEVVANAIRTHSPRKDGPFVAVNCGALPADLLESELFGHVRGAFTGAVRDRVGRFELASGGTLFLDEVGDLPLPLQVKLLRVLQEHVFERVGESRSRTADARIIAATNVDLRRAIAEGRFREDLYYRLRVVPIELPPLRERRADIEPLAKLLLARVGARQGRLLQISPATLRLLLGYSWPGNVRELENALEFAVAVCKGQTLMPEDLPSEVAAPAEPQSRAVPAASPATDDSVEESPERRRIREALEAHRWRREAAAESLGMSRTTLWRKMRELGLIPGPG